MHVKASVLGTEPSAFLDNGCHVVILSGSCTCALEEPGLRQMYIFLYESPSMPYTIGNVKKTV